MARKLSPRQVRYLWAIGYFKGVSRSASPVHTTKESANTWMQKHLGNYAQNAGPYNEVSPEIQKQIVSVAMYTASAYSDINNDLRGVKSSGRIFSQEKTAEFTRDIDKAFQTLGRPLPETIQVHRGVGNEFTEDLIRRHREGTLIGSTISDAGYMSTSLNSQFPVNWAQGKREPTTMILTVKKGERVLPIVSDSSEILLQRGRKIRVTAVKKNTWGQNEIHGEVD